MKIEDEIKQKKFISEHVKCSDTVLETYKFFESGPLE